MLFTLWFINLIVWCTAQKQNFLLIIVDDLRTALGCYGDAKAYTPNIDRLATGAAIFSQAFAQQALCAPSRNSFLTSRRPDTLHLYDFYSYWRKDIDNFTTLPQHLKNNGYITKSVGKVFHPGISSNNSDDSPYSWSETPFHPFTERYKDAPMCQTNMQMLPAQNLLCPVKVSSMPNKTLPDIEILREAKTFLSNQAGNSSPFFLAVGFQKPHIPFKYPKKYLKNHPLHKFEVPKPYKWSNNVSSIAYNPWNDLRKREDVAALNLKFPWEKIPKSFARLIIQSYYASVTYIDDLIGTLINHLERLSIRGDTTIILMSDHGWSLGEHAVWAKYSNYDVALKVPLIVSIPGLTYEKLKENTNVNNSSKGNQIFIDSIVELVDIFPTIADLANISIPICSNESMQITCSEGITFIPLIRAALKNEVILWKKAAFAQYPRPSIEPSIHPNSDEPRLKEIKAMGYTLRTNTYRYIAWLSFNPETMSPNWNNIIAEELYDYSYDKGENQNVAFLEEYAKLKEKLKILLQHGWRNILSAKSNF
ncbi:iduronate 2-sulfatase isoform X2 [Bombus vancouverensis nearcticus]|uniref:iduronate 2-sulfatase isoform X2 n=1 Tax=Bombus vancouverensis nearcticus TaxID=2705178 RepID=UPI001438F039|nr:iduronate 2-sulfatase isoform X1 [Bombus vancouverensis nearcticus]